MSGNVYFIAAPEQGLVKIGFATDVSARFSAIRTGSPSPLALIATMQGTIDDEAELHRLFKQARSHLEWFCYTGMLAKLISCIVIQHCDDLEISDRCIPIVPMTDLCSIKSPAVMDRWDFEDSCIEAGLYVDWRTVETCQ